MKKRFEDMTEDEMSTEWHVIVDRINRLRGKLKGKLSKPEREKLVKSIERQESKFFELEGRRMATSLLKARPKGRQAQKAIIECDEKPLLDWKPGMRTQEEVLMNSYCAKCASPNLKITKIIQIKCRKCGRTRLITSRLDRSKR